MTNAPPEQKDLRAYLRPVLKRWWLILAVVPVVTIGTYLYYDGKPKTFQASTEAFVQPSALDQLLFGRSHESDANVENMALLIQTSAVGKRAAGHLAKDPAGVPSGGISAQAIEKSSFIVITGTAPTPRGAARLANAYATAFLELQKRQIRSEAKRTARTAEKQLDELGAGPATVHRREALEQQIQNLQLVASQPDANAGIRQVERAVPNSEPIDHNPTDNAIFAFVISLMLAVGAAFGLEYLSRKLTSVEDVEDAFGLPVLTEIPQVASPAPFEGHGVAMPRMLHEPFHRLQANLEMQARERPLRTILVASAVPEEGKSIVARNLALAYRDAGRNVAAFDADFRRPSLGGLLAAQEGLGLSDVLAGRASFGQVVQEVPIPVNGNGSHGGGELAMVPAGERHGGLAAALASGEMRQTLTAAADAYGTAIVDSPPLLAVADVLPLLAEADAVILVARLGVTTRDSVRRLLAELERVPGLYVAGVVVNGIQPRVYRARSYDEYYG